MEEVNEPIGDHYEKLETSEFIASVNPRIEIKSIEFEGLKRTDKDLLMRTLGLCGMEDSKSLLELSNSLSKAFDRLERLNVFKDVSVVIDQADTNDSIPNMFQSDSEPIQDVKVVFKCKEKRFNIRTGTELQRKDIAWVNILTFSITFIVLELWWSIF